MRPFPAMTESALCPPFLPFIFLGSHKPQGTAPPLSQVPIPAVVYHTCL